MGIIDLSSPINRTQFNFNSEIGPETWDFDSDTPEFVDCNSETETIVDRDTEVFDGN